MAQTAVRLPTLGDEMAAMAKAAESLLDREQVALERLQEVGGLAEATDRLDQAQALVLECDEVAGQCKQLAELLTRIRKRMDGVTSKATDGMLDEVRSLGGEIETREWKYRVKLNPPSVVVDDLSVVPKKYRHEPDPVPPPDEWPVNKTMVKEALTKEKVQSIPGVHIEQAESLSVKPR